MRRSLAVLALALTGCAPAVLELRVNPSRLPNPQEVRAVAQYRGKVGADRIVWQVCQYTTAAGVEYSDRTFEAFFPCAMAMLPRVTLYRDGREIASATTPGPLLIGATE